jgi:hypothetical protein
MTRDRFTVARRLISEARGVIRGACTASRIECALTFEG